MSCRSESTTLSAEQVHLHALEAHRVGNRGRLALAQALRILQDRQDFLELGFSSVVGYADKTFGFRKSETYGLIKVARALDELPRSLEAFAAGEICWTALRAITDVATAESEELWLKFATEHTSEQLWRETRDARRKSSDRPRERGYGLPALGRRVSLRLTASQYEKFRKVMQLFAGQAAEKLGRSDVGFEDALLLLCEQVLAAEAGHADSPAAATGAARYALVYQACPECRQAGVHTPEGLVEVGAEEVERIIGEATVEGGPTPPALRRKVLLRDGALCSNPHCSSPADHAHHVVFRSEGGATAKFNLVAVCRTCHGLIHAGLLEVGGRVGQLAWRRRGERVDAGDLRAPRLDADRLPVFRIESTVDSTAVESASLEADVISALRNLGYNAAEARSRTKRAFELAVSPIAPLEELIPLALAGRRRGSPPAEPCPQGHSVSSAPQ